MSTEHRRLTHALLLSLLIHALLLTLTFGGQGIGLPGFGFPWQDRRIEAPDLRVVVVPVQVTAAEPAVTPVAQPMQQARVEQPVASGSVLTPSASRPPTPQQTAAANVPEANPGAVANPRTDAATGAVPAQTPLRADQPGDTAPPPTPAPAVIAVTRTDESTWVVPVTPAVPTPFIEAAPSAPGPETALPSLPNAGGAGRARIDQEAEERAVELAKVEPPSKQEGQRQEEQMEAARVVAARQEAARAENAQLEAERQEVARQAADLQEAARQVAARQKAALLEATRQAAGLQEAARQVAARQEAALLETARVEAAQVEAARVEAERVKAAQVEAERVKAAQVEAARVEAARVEAARVEAARVEAAQVEAARVEAARVEAEQVEAARVEAARVEAARVEAERVKAAQVEGARVEAARAEAARVEAARVEAARAEAAQVEAAQVEAARVKVAQEAAERREAALRAIGKQLDEEAARREAAMAAARPSGTGRRYRLFGRTDPNAELILYAEAWARKIQLNMTFDMVREAVKQPHTNPLVTVAIRSDGSVESVTFVQSSGVAALDEAIRHVVQSQTPYQVFPPGLSRDFDVIEIRRTWYFDTAIRLY
jgi:chemotaxis protein histidine kinase CheA